MTLHNSYANLRNKETAQLDCAHSLAPVLEAARQGSSTHLSLEPQLKEDPEMLESGVFITTSARMTFI